MGHTESWPVGCQAPYQAMYWLAVIHKWVSSEGNITSHGMDFWKATLNTGQSFVLYPRFFMKILQEINKVVLRKF